MIAVDYLWEDAFKDPIETVEKKVGNCELLEIYDLCKGCIVKLVCDKRYDRRVGAGIDHSKRLTRNGIKDEQINADPYMRTTSLEVYDEECEV